MNRLAIALGALLTVFCGAGGVGAQTQVQPFYGVTSTTGAKGMQGVDATHGLPVGAPAVATCGGQSLTAGIVYPITQDLTGTVCTASGAGTTTNTNLVGINGVTPLVGNGVTGTGSQRVTIASDNTPFSVNATLSAETTKVIGTVNQGTSPWVVTGAGGTFPATQSGVWTVQPGNTPNTTPWLVTNTPSSASGAALTPVTTSALAANQIVKAGAGNLYSFEVAADSTLSGAAWWIMIYNAASAPADGAVTPLKCYAMASGVTAFAAAFPAPVAFSTGITIGVSTTGCFTKTASTHAFISGDGQ